MIAILLYVLIRPEWKYVQPLPYPVEIQRVTDLPLCEA